VSPNACMVVSALLLVNVSAHHRGLVSAAALPFAMARVQLMGHVHLTVSAPSRIQILQLECQSPSVNVITAGGIQHVVLQHAHSVLVMVHLVQVMASVLVLRCAYVNLVGGDMHVTHQAVQARPHRREHAQVMVSVTLPRRVLVTLAGLG
jgi:hypothetical protein